MCKFIMGVRLCFELGGEGDAGGDRIVGLMGLYEYLRRCNMSCSL